MFSRELLIYHDISGLPRELDVETLRALGVRDILENVAELLELLRSSDEGLLNVVLGEDRVVELVNLLVPEAVEEGGVGESLALLSNVLGVENNVLLVATLGEIESCSNLVEKNLLVLVTGNLELSEELLIALLALFLDVRNLLSLNLAELSSGHDHLAGHLVDLYGSYLECHITTINFSSS